ncbi:MAG: molybdopterin-synthase adenylyltransferase MoeB [Planctomycetota bacterium]|jgi:adenylyltransferase/sulfurtransferase|nr:molybdopterin-synthase adenylyltransferase MoeB [Planctomycetota bacterium]
MEALKPGAGENIPAENEIRRYGRQIIIPEIGWDGQNRLKQARVLVVGAGGLGSPVVLYLAAAGVGCIGLVDADMVDESNLQRQVLYAARDVGCPKARSARDRILALNPLVRAIAFETVLDSANAMEIIGDFDAVVDCSDNFPTRYLVNDACVLLGKPNVFGAVQRFEGQASVFAAPNAPCYRCFFAEPPGPGAAPTCAEAGVLGVLPGIIGCIQAAETIKLLLGAENTLAGRLLLVDAWTMRFRELAVRKDPRCPVCGENPCIRELIDYRAFCGVGKSGVAEENRSINALALKAMMEMDPRLKIVEIREPHESELVAFPNRSVMTLREVRQRRNEFDPSRVVVFACKFGIRSGYAVRLLVETGYAGKVFNLRDGIFGWMREIGKPFSGDGG